MDRAGGVPKIQMARSGARQTAAFIAKHTTTSSGSSTSTSPAHVLTPLRRLSPGAVAAERRRLDRDPPGRRWDDIYAGLRAGFEQLQNATTKQRHMILMTDGISAGQLRAAAGAAPRRAHHGRRRSRSAPTPTGPLLRQIANRDARTRLRDRQRPPAAQDLRQGHAPERQAGTRQRPPARARRERQPDSAFARRPATAGSAWQRRDHAESRSAGRPRGDQSRRDDRSGARPVAGRGGTDRRVDAGSRGAVGDGAGRRSRRCSTTRSGGRDRGAVAGRLVPTPTAVSGTLGLDLSQAGARAAVVPLSPER